MTDVNIVTKLLTPNPYSRPKTKLSGVKAIVVHWTASPMGRNVGVWNYFERRKSGTNGYGSAHYIIDLDGTIWNCIPTDEIAYHVGSSTYTNEAKTRIGSYPNALTIGIEFCILDIRGRMSESTWKEGTKLVAHLLEKFNLTQNDIWTHQEVVGWKDCHRYFSENPTEYQRFKNEVNLLLNPTFPTTITSTTGEFYTVKAGDTIWGISQDFNTTVAKITQLNPNINPYVLPIGTQVRVRESAITKYQIQQGDTLWGIAIKFDTTVVNLKEINPNVDVYALQIGEYINVTETISSNITPLLTSSTTSINYESILPNKILQIGDTGEDVVKLQNALNKLYFTVGYADGIFGITTKDAIQRYQSMYFGLKVDGIFGSDTREHMLQQLLK